MPNKKKVELTKGEQTLVDALIDSAGTHCWQQDQGSKRSEIEKAEKDLKDDKLALEKLILRLKRRIANLEARS